MSQTFDEEKTRRTLHLGFAEGRKRAFLHGEGVVEAEETADDGWKITVNWTVRQERRYREA